MRISRFSSRRSRNARCLTESQYKRMRFPRLMERLNCRRKTLKESSLSADDYLSQSEFYDILDRYHDFLEDHRNRLAFVTSDRESDRISVEDCLKTIETFLRKEGLPIRRSSEQPYIWLNLNDVMEAHWFDDEEGEESLFGSTYVGQSLSKYFEVTREGCGDRSLKKLLERLGDLWAYVNISSDRSGDYHFIEQIIESGVHTDDFDISL